MYSPPYVKKRISSMSFVEAADSSLFQEWASDLNTISPAETSAYSHSKVYWRCPSGHTWQAAVGSRMRGRGCPECYAINKGALVRQARIKNGSVPLSTAFPELIAEWDFSKNTLTPELVSQGSNTKVHWKCKFGHEWKTTVTNRTSRKSNCPFCTSQTSRLEIFLLCEIRALFKAVEWRKKIDGVEADIFLTEHKIAIEVDGDYWHREKHEKDAKKTAFFSARGVSTVRVRAEALGDIGGLTIWFSKTKEEIQVCLELMKTLYDLTSEPSIMDYLAAGVAANEQDFKEMLARLPAPPENESLAATYPEVAAQWDYLRNAPLTPDLFSPQSGQRFWWACDVHHHWQATIKNRTVNGSGCPWCNEKNHSLNVHKRFAKAKGSLAMHFPQLATFWDFTKNADLTPENISIKSTRKCFWLCEQGHSVERTPANFVKDNSCPVCNSLELQCPEIMLEWDFDRNLEIMPSDVSVGSGQRVWWKCRRGHSFDQVISQRTQKSRNTNCPVCWAIKRGVIESLAIARHRGALLSAFNPELIKYWDATKNPNHSLVMLLTVNEKSMYWWKCGQQHSFQQSPFRMASGYNCPTCGTETAIEKIRLKKLERRGSLFDLLPELATYWHKTANSNLTSQDVGKGSHQIVWWQCPYGHEFQRSVNDMVTLYQRRSKSLCMACKKPTAG